MVGPSVATLSTVLLSSSLTIMLPVWPMRVPISVRRVLRDAKTLFQSAM